MSKRIGLIHATRISVTPVNNAFKNIAPEYESLNFLDEGLMFEVNREGKVTNKTLRRFISIINKAEENGVDGILAVCSVFTPFHEQLSKLVEVPFINADLAMLEEALNRGENIGVIATVEEAERSSEKILQDLAKRDKKEINIITKSLPDAFSALKNGEEETHDQRIRTEIKNLQSQCDVIVLAQVSMARAIKDSDESINIPVLTSLDDSIKKIINAI